MLVNRLYRMCLKNITQPFKFFCYTDNATNLAEAVNIIPFVDHGLDIIVHNKLYLFSKEVDQYLDPGLRLYFDVDLIIKHNIDHLLSCDTDGLTLIRASWREELPQGKYCPDCFNKIQGYSHHHQLNSSCMIWESPNTRCIWEHFIKNSDYFTLAFPLGMDSFLNYETTNAGSKIAFFPERSFWSHDYGVDHYERKAILRKNKHASYFAFEEQNRSAVDRIPIVLLNGPNTAQIYKHYREFYEV